MESYKNEKSNILTPGYKQINPTLLSLLWCDLGLEPWTKWLTSELSNVDAQGWADNQSAKAVIPKMSALMAVLTHSIHYSLTERLKSKPVAFKVNVPDNLLL